MRLRRDVREQAPPSLRRRAALSDALSGTWIVSRRYEGHGARFAGQAVFSPLHGRTFRYHEHGRMTLPDGYVGSAHQSYLYLFGRERVQVFLGDGGGRELFVSLDVSAMTEASSRDGFEARDVHRCRDDVYDVRYIFALPDVFRTVIDVSGPRKRYRADTEYVRHGGPAASGSGDVA